MDAQELVDLLKKEKFAIYGSGHVAKKFFKALCEYGAEKNIICFAVSDSAGATLPIEGFEVKNVREIPQNTLVCIAVHEALRDEMINTLKQLRIERYVWIYPHLYELLLGEAVKRDVSVRLTDILRTCRTDYRMAVRYAAIDNYFGKNENGFELYKRAQMLHCSKKTAEERLESFCKLIQSWNTKGYDKRSRVLVNEEYEIIDGNHRVALAVYYGQKEMICHVYHTDGGVNTVHGQDAMLTEEVLRKNGFKEEELEALECINEEIRGKVE